MRIGIVGAGSIGSLLAGCLSTTSTDLLLYGRGLHAAHLTVEGLIVEGVQSQTTSSQRWEVLLAEHPLPESVRGCCDVVMMTGKSSTFDEHLSVAKHILHTDGFVCTLSNGLGHEERLVHAFGAHRVLAATTTHGAYRPQAGTVHWAGKGKISIGPFVYQHSEESVTELIEVLHDANLNRIGLRMEQFCFGTRCCSTSPSIHWLDCSERRTAPCSKLHCLKHPFQ